MQAILLNFKVIFIEAIRGSENEGFIAFLKPLLNFSILLCLLCHSQVGQTYTQVGTEVTANIQRTLNQSLKFGMRPTLSETRVKEELLRLKRQNPLEFRQKLADAFTNTAEFQGWLLEVQDGVEQVAKAKSIAKWSFYQALQRNWPQVKTISININASEDWTDFAPYLIDKLNGIQYQSKDRQNNFIFVVEDWGRVMVSPNFRSASWRLNVDSRYDGNQIQRGLMNMRIPREQP